MVRNFSAVGNIRTIEFKSTNYNGLLQKQVGGRTGMVNWMLVIPLLYSTFYSLEIRWVEGF
jgi:hypothetical protein